MKGSFYGWYFKCQSDAQTLALIPSLHQSVWSMEHTVRGNVCINGEQYSFAKGRGYWEGDRGLLLKC